MVDLGECATWAQKEWVSCCCWMVSIIHFNDFLLVEIVVHFYGLANFLFRDSIKYWERGLKALNYICGFLHFSFSFLSGFVSCTLKLCSMVHKHLGLPCLHGELTLFIIMLCPYIPVYILCSEVRVVWYSAEDTEWRPFSACSNLTGNRTPIWHF